MTVELDVLWGVLLGWAGGMVVPRLWRRSRLVGQARARAVAPLGLA